MASVEILPPESSVETAFKKKDEIDISDDASYPSRRKLNVDLTGTKEGGLGMVIVGGYKDGKQFGIFVKTIKETGPVFKDGRIRVGDQLLAANGKSLLGVSNDQAVQTLKQCALTDEVILAVVRDVTSRHDFKRLSQVMNFNPGETPPEIRDVRHTVIPTMDQSRSSSPTSSLPSVSDVSNPEQDGDNYFKSSSTPAVLEDVRKGALVYDNNYVSSSLQELGRYRQEKDSESPISQDRNVSATDVKLSMRSSPHSKLGEEEDAQDKGMEEMGRGNHVPPPCPTSPIPDDEVPPPLPGDPPPLDEDSDESQAPSLPPTLPPKQTDFKLTEDSLSAETLFNKRLTFIFPKMLGIGITVKGGTNMPNGPAVYIDKVIRGLDAAKDSNLRSGDQLIAVNGESYEGLTQEEAQKQLTMLKTKHQLKKYEIVVDREISEEEMVNYEPPMKTPTNSPLTKSPPTESLPTESLPTKPPPTEPPPTEPPPTEPPPTEPPPTEPPPTKPPLEESPSGETPPVVLPLGTTKKWLNGSIEDGGDEGSGGRDNRESGLHNGIHDNMKTSSEASLTPSLPKDSPPSESSSKSSLHGQKDTGRPDEMMKMEEYRTGRNVVDGPVLRGTKPREKETVKAPRKQEEPNIFVAATLPVGSTKPSRESGGSQRVSINPATPIKDTPTRERREHDSSYHARLSLDPHTRVKLSKLEMGLRYTGHNLSSQQQQELRKQLDIDEEGKVTFAEFIDVAREMFAFKLDDHMFEPGSLFSLALSPKDNLEPPIFSKRGYSMISNSDSSHSSHGASLLEDEMEAKRQQLYEEGKQRVERRPSADKDSLKKQVEKQQDEIRRLKARLVDSEVITRQLEVKLQGSEMQSSAKASDVESLKKRLTLSEAACKAAKIKENHLNEVMHGLQQQLAAAKKQVIDQTPAEMKRRMTVLDCQLKKEQASNRRYQVAVEMMLEFCEKSHETLVASADMGPVVFHPRGKGESVRRGDPISGNPRPPQYLAQHSKRTNVTLAQEAKEVVKSVRALLGKDELPFGWEERRTEEGEKYYINHQTQSTSWVRPPSSRSGSGASTPQHGRVNM